VATAHHDLAAYKQELEYIKREDVLDEGGRQRPVLIQSNDSDLLEKLQINEFLYEAQQARNPVPPMVEKVAQLLALLHEGQGRADQYLGDLSKSNGLVSALRQRNVALYSRTQMFESFKTRALTRYVMNLIEGEMATDLHLDGLSFNKREIKEMLLLIPRYEATEKIYVVSLIDNGLEDDSVNMILQLVYMLPYLRRIDLKRNCFTPDGIRKFNDQIKMMEGITSVIRTADTVLNAHSGNQLRFAVDFGEQMTKEVLAKEPDFEIQENLSHKDADPFLTSNSGATGHPWTKTLAAQVQKPPHQAIPEASTTILAKSSAAPEPPAVGGPPVGLGGPGNVAALNRRSSQSKGASGKKVSDGRKQSKRAKDAPPPVLLDYDPTSRALDNFRQLQRPSSADRRSTGSLRAPSSDMDSDKSARRSEGRSGMTRGPHRSASSDLHLARGSSCPTLPPYAGPYSSSHTKAAPPPLTQRVGRVGQRPPRM